MCCETPKHDHPTTDQVSCCCCYPPRHFVGSREKKERLEKYRDQLKNELEGVEEELEKMGK
jgi:hypothetical protein